MVQRAELSAFRTLMDRIDALGMRYGREQSFKLLPGRVLAERGLVGLQRSELDARAFAELGRSLGMPAAAQSLLASRFLEANVVFFATEEDGPSRLFKAYLEFWDLVRARVRAGDASPQLLHLGVKWSSDRPGRHEEAHYMCHPLLTVQHVLQRMRAVYPPGAPDHGLRAAQQLVRLGVQRRPRASFLYLEASEAGNPRRSFDVNFYKTGLSVGDAVGPLQDAARHFGVQEERIEPILQGMRDLPLGHIAGGTDRHGGEFLSVYAEVAALPDAR